MAQHDSVIAQYVVTATGDVDPETGHISVWPVMTHQLCGREIWNGEQQTLRGDTIFQFMYDHRCPDGQSD